MKKNYILSLLLLISSIGVFAQDEVINIPDANFKKRLLNHNPVIDTNGDGEIQKSEAEAFTGKIKLDDYPDFPDKNGRIKKLDREAFINKKNLSTDVKVYDLTGIEYFINITELDCSNNKLTKLDISKNIKITLLSCYDNEISEIDISKNINLKVLICSKNQLTELDVSKNLNLEALFCGNNKLTQLDVSKNKMLKEMNLRGHSPHYPLNNLTQLDISNNINLVSLNCAKGELTELDISKNTKLKALYCSENQLTVLDVSKNTKLEALDCSENELTELNLSENTKLKELDCAENKLQQLDVSKNLNLKELWCGYASNYKWLGNLLTQLDISKNVNLTILYCSNNQLTQLDVSKNINLEYIYCSNNQLSQLDVSKNTKLKRVDCSRNVIDLKGLWSIKSSLSSDSDFIYEKQNNIFSMVSVSDVYEADYTEQAVINGKNTVFKWYNVSGELVDDNSIIEPVAGITGKFLIKSKGAFYCQMSNPEFPDLKINTKLICFSSSTEETVDIPDVILKGYLLKDKAINTNLDGEIQLSEAHNYKSKIWVFNKGIKSLKGIESFVNITELHCRGNWLKEIDVSKNTKLKTLICSSNKFEELDVSKNTELKKLDCYNNQLTQLDLSNNTELTELSCGSNKLTKLDISKNIELNDLNCGYNQLTELDVFKNTELKELRCGSNKLAQLDISKNTKLTSLVCDYNQLTELDVSKNIELTGLNCRGNRLTHFDVSKNTKLTGLYCGYNKLTELDVSKNIKLTSLSFDGNILTKIDISKNPKLTYLDCQRNKFSFTELWNIKSNLSIDAQFDYEPQNKIFNKQNLKQNAVIDYSSELTVNGKTTNFVWYNAISNSEVDETSVQKTEEGKFKFLKYGQYYCKMTNAEFEDLELQTNTIYILKDQTLTFDVQKTVFVNDKITLNATVSSGLDITYEIVSGKTTLDGNILTPTAEGTLVIKAVQAGNNEYEPVEKEVTIQVTKRDQTITFDVKEAAKLNEKITLAATASSNLDVTYEVVSGNATLDGCTVTFTEAGKVQIKAIQAGNNEYNATEKIVDITVTKSTAIDNLSVIGAKIYPNPVTDILNIELPETDSYRVTVFNSTGDIVTQQTASSVNTAIDMSEYNSGIYIIKATTDNRSYTGKIVKR